MKIKSILLLASVLATAVSLSAQSLISFTFSGYVNSASNGGVGYSGDQFVSFTFIMADHSPVVTADGQNSVEWEDFGQPSQRLIQSVSGTGITGTWLAPVVNGGAGTNSTFSVQHSPTEEFNLTFHTWDDSGGLLANGNNLGQIKISASSGNPLGFGTLPSSGSPIDLLTGVIGSYDLEPSFFVLGEIFDSADEASASFMISNITISAYSAVPEPSTYVAIFGGLALAGAIWMRRHKA